MNEALTKYKAILQDDPQGWGLSVLSESDKVLRRDAGMGLSEAWKLHEGGVRLYTRSEEHTSELQSLSRISYAVFCLKKYQLKIQIA